MHNDKDIEKSGQADEAFQVFQDIESAVRSYCRRFPAVFATARKPDDKGDLYGSVEVQVPTALSPAEREHWEALAKLSGGAATTNSAA